VIQQPEDDTAPVRGIVNGLLIVALFWSLVATALRYWWW
jgi:hypothetical protein